MSFHGEPGLDLGGLTKEWFLLLIRNIFREEYGKTDFHVGYYSSDLAYFTGIRSRNKTFFVLANQHFYFLQKAD